MRGWHFLATQFLKRRVCVISSQKKSVLVNKLIYVLRVLGEIEDVIHATRECDDSRFLSQVASTAKPPCVVIDYLSVYPRSWNLDVLIFMAHQKKCLLLFTTSFMAALPVYILQFAPCLVWELGYHVSIPLIAAHSPLVNHFYQQDRDALLHRGPIFCDGVDNVCVTLCLEGESTCFSDLVTQIQQHFRKKVTSAKTIQRFIKQYLYRPDQGLGQAIVQRLTVMAQ